MRCKDLKCTGPPSMTINKELELLQLAKYLHATMLPYLLRILFSGLLAISHLALKPVGIC